MKMFQNIFLISFIFLSLLFFQCLTFETSSKSGVEEVLELLQKDESYPSQIIKNFDFHVNSFSENDKITNLIKEHVRKKGNEAKPRKYQGKPAINKKKTNPPKKRPIPPKKQPIPPKQRPILPKKRPIPPKKKPIPPNKKTRKIGPKKPNARKFVPNQHVEIEAVKTEHKPKKPEETEHKPKKPEEIEHKPKNPEVTEHKSKKPEETEHKPKKPEVTESKIMKSTTENVVPRPSFEKLVEIKNRFYTQVNELRKRHHANPLVINPEIAKEVQNYIDHTLDNDINFPIYTGPYGENFDSGFNEDEINPFEDWTSASENFNYTHPVINLQSSSFTQLIWKSTTDIGCGANSDDFYTYFICRFSPKGNIPGQYAENVLPE